ncbi:MAG: hypothetical protein ABJC51_07320, partial [Acidobacteriota bacterium]
EGACDTGVVQIDSVRLDEAATLSAAVDFYAGFAERVRLEAARLERDDARLVISDAPPLACAAAAAAGIPSVVLSNFTWDWIYEAYGAASAPGLLSAIRAAYGLAEAGWRLPLHGGFAGCKRVIDVPFVARHATVPAAEVRRRLGLPTQTPLVLTSFGGYGLDAFDPLRLDCGGRWHVVVTGREPPSPGPEWLHALDDNAVYDAGMRYEDLVAAADVVVTKPGYGIISECIANRTAMLYTSRGRFPEYDVMVAEMPRLLRCAFIDRAALLEGRWLTALETLARTPPPAERPRTVGAEMIAAMIAARVGD